MRLPAAARLQAAKRSSSPFLFFVGHTYRTTAPLRIAKSSANDVQADCG